MLDGSTNSVSNVRQQRHARPMAAHGQWEAALHLPADVDGLNGAVRFQHRRVRLNRDRLGEVTHQQREVEGQVQAGADHHPSARDFGEPLLLSRDDVLARRRSSRRDAPWSSETAVLAPATVALVAVMVTSGSTEP